MGALNEEKLSNLSDISLNADYSGKLLMNTRNHDEHWRRHTFSDIDSIKQVISLNSLNCLQYINLLS